MLENGIKPVYVFDGKPPERKAEELKRRGDRRAEAERGHADAAETGDQAMANKYAKRSVKVTPKHNEECQRLLELMGIPYVKVC